MYYGENIPPNIVDENYRTPQSMPSIKPKSSQYTSIRPSPQSAVSPVSNHNRTTPDRLRTLLVEQGNHQFEYPVEMAPSSIAGESEVAHAFRSQVLQACAESSGLDISGLDLRQDPSFAPLEIPYIPPTEFSYQPAAEAPSFQQMIEVPYGVSFAAEPVVSAETGDVGESFRQQVLAACTRVALESWLDDATPDRNWTPLETRAVSPVVLNHEVNKKLVSSMHSPAQIVAATSLPSEIESTGPPVELPLVEIPVAVQEKTVVTPGDVPETFAPIEVPLAVPEQPVESPSQQEKEIFELVADIPPIPELVIENRAPSNLPSPALKLARTESVIDTEPLSPVRDSIRLLEKTSANTKATPGSIKRQLKQKTFEELQAVPVVDVPNIVRDEGILMANSGVPEIQKVKATANSADAIISDGELADNQALEETMAKGMTIWDELGLQGLEFPTNEKGQEDGGEKRCLVENGIEEERHVMSPAMREQHSLLIDELKLYFSSAKKNNFVDQEEQVGESNGQELVDVGESNNNSLTDLVQALNFNNEPLEHGMTKAQPSAASFTSGTIPPPSLQLLTDPDVVQTPVRKKRGFFSCCCK